MILFISILSLLFDSLTFQYSQKNALIQITKAIQALINDHFRAAKVSDAEAQVSLSEKTDALEVVKHVTNVESRLCFWNTYFGS